VRAELTKRLDVKPAGIGGEIIAIALPNIGSMGGAYGRSEGATAEKAVPFPGAARRLLNLLSTDGVDTGGS
jgi:hypothetical protein